MYKRFLTALLILAIVFFGWFFERTRPVSPKQTGTIEFEIKSGWGIDRVGQELSNAKLIRSRAAFKITVVTMGISNRVQAGFFRLSPSMSITDIAKSLTHASVKTVRVTIPEGLRRQEIALILDNSFKNIESKTFSSAEFISQTTDKEGRLFPDTYDFDPKASASAIITKLENKYEEVISEIKVTPENQDKVTIIASLLEREAASASEMPEIAGVIENRLANNWPLQIDATVQYALSNTRCKKLDCNWWPNNLTKTDIQINSPYNTYKNQGLPPRPISSPGAAALKAAAAPQKTTSWFYLHDSKGVIHFAKTIEEHNQNVCTYLRKDCSK
ncbi:MAG TPA: endolytic transglycosylase MltG [Spirochaetia bacterium]|nr:endolytic transglycosylase MltG [Spirochaetia bacterium]